jgi:hypothetical protein
MSSNFQIKKSALHLGDPKETLATYPVCRWFTFTPIGLRDSFTDQNTLFLLPQHRWGGFWKQFSLYPGCSKASCLLLQILPENSI